ncbi:lipid II:glycine glycyltransferase FemX [Acutalibacter caecimuris]|uniref:lipid II:glycine glycyltransferase FemX n=1 Tax=Acutalibacter caecimuris TaxID=3093657 RepID=UPI002AC9CFF1|nr:peptidoglycan bridge formation glycyltransferase FemA/FemB family protein [Acutalibacter sp. M00118]
MEFLDFTNLTAVYEYERFVESHGGNFTQSVRWCGVKRGWYHEAIISRDGRGEIQGTALVLVKKFPPPFKSFLYAPRGPVCDYSDPYVLQDILAGLEELAKKYHAYSCKLDPMVEESESGKVFAMRRAGLQFIPWQPDDLTIQCRSNYILELGGRSEDELMQSFKSKCRYNIRLAQRKGVTCRAYGKERLGDFQRLMEETHIRDGFQGRKREYFARMMDALGDHCRLYLCEYQGQPLSGAICVQYGGRTCYVYGASTSAHREVMPNYLMQWEMIRWAVQSGCSIYDFQGVPYWYDANHPNYGVYRFKTGFNGRLAIYAGEFTQVYHQRYKAAFDRALKCVGYQKLV